MGSPTCVANSSVPKEKVQATQTEADKQFKAGTPVADKELLSKSERKKRAAEICKSTGLCGQEAWKKEDGSWGRKYDLSDYALIVTDALVPPTGLHSRTLTNLARLFASKRVSTQQIVDLIKLEQADQKTDFRKAAQGLFLSAQLFFYDYVPHKGAIMCYMEGK